MTNEIIAIIESNFISVQNLNTMTKLLKEELEKFPVRDTIKVQWGDMDSARHVNNTIYLRWAETARIAFFLAVKIESEFKDEIGPILGWTDCKFIFPITFPDTVHYGIRVSEFKEDRFIMETVFYSERFDRIAAISKSEVLAYDYSQLKKMNIPNKWKAAIKYIQDDI